MLIVDKMTPHNYCDKVFNYWPLVLWSINQSLTEKFECNVIFIVIDEHNNYFSFSRCVDQYKYTFLIRVIHICFIDPSVLPSSLDLSSSQDRATYDKRVRDQAQRMAPK